MSKVYLICGKICSGKTVLARRIAEETGAILLSVDERMLSMERSGLHGDKHDEIAARVREELYQETVHMIADGQSVILDWGFWTKEWRMEADQFCRQNGMDYEWHYMDVSDLQWKRNIAGRNKAILAGETTGYIVDDGLMQKLLSRFEPPEKTEIDVWHSYGE